MAIDLAVVRAAKLMLGTNAAHLLVLLLSVGSAEMGYLNQERSVITRIKWAAQSGAKWTQDSFVGDLLHRPVSETTQFAEMESRKWLSLVMMGTKLKGMGVDLLA